MIIRPKKYPKTGTSSVENYYYSNLETANFLNWVTFMVGGMDEMRRQASEALAIIRDEKTSDTETEERIMLEELKKNRTLLFYMLLTRIIDNYLSYLSDILVEAFRAKPEAMRSSEKIEVADILQFDNFADIVVHVAEKKVHSLSYQSIIDLDEYFKSKFGVFIVSESDKPLLIEAIETRNLITHNRGIRNRRYLKRVRENESKLGKTRKFGLDYFQKVDNLLFESVKRIDTSFRKKLGVPGHRFNIYESFKNRT